MPEYNHKQSGKKVTYVVHWDRIGEKKQRELMGEAINREVAAYCRKLAAKKSPLPATLEYPLPAMPKTKKSLESMSPEQILSSLSQEKLLELAKALQEITK